MSIPLSKLEKFFYVDKLIIHSLDLALYQASVVVDGKVQFITYDNGIFLRAHSLIEMQKKCKNIKANKQVLVHKSAHDEMVGLPEGKRDNQLEVLVRDTKLY
ncbi:DUF6482 family protein [Vibrio diabolicus]|uniref:DUF6482 family protein n=1 Tax=Vibrio diabolicus TaxID=50719 RepID=UPI00215F0A0E|nr:DUF6482 family protein [Vibrio diabolicus]MCS0386520.1 DUF6482 family protein [Vibrio diabolicus]